MGKRTLNPMEDFRRQKRKKEVAKNKTTRISARDERVKETKTVKEVEQAIKDMEKRGTKTPAEQQKLQRLQKELKLVKDEATKPKEVAAAMSVQPQRLTELDDPRKSVYYDETLNPYGAPPPGKPRLYHRRGGGETMDIREAVVPGQDELSPSVDLPNPTELQQRQSHSQPQRPHQPPRLPRNEFTSNPPRLNQNQKMPPPLPPPPPPPPPLPKEKSPAVPPPLPEPSSAAQRTKRKTGILADIWASTEEVSYERTVKCNDLEDSNNRSGWWYRDTSQNVQGPFGTEQILDWSRGGFFPPDTPVRQGEKGKWWAMGDVDWTTGERKVVKNKQGGAVEDRIAALRKQPPMPMPRHDEIPACAEDLREEALTAENDDDDDDDESGDDRSVSARIEALKQLSSTRADGDGGVSDRTHALEQEHDPSTEEDADDGIAARIAALRQPLVDNQSGVETRVHALAGMTNEVDASNSVTDVECLKRAGVPHDEIMPFAYPMLETGEPPVYPIDDTAPYPSGEDVAYPIYDEPLDLQGDIPYPVDAYPVTGAYAEESSEEYPVSAYDTPVDEQAKTTLLVVPGLVPTHLQKSRKSRSAAKVVVAKPKLPQEKPAKENSKAVADDYENFMEEIAGLK